MDVNRVYGMAVGHALGDALGAPHEFARLKNPPYTGVLQYEPRVPSRFHGVRQGVVGQVTDDTEMALALLNTFLDNETRPLIKKSLYDKDKVIKAYERWSNSRPIGQGRNTAALFRGVATVEGYKTRRAKIPGTESNGSLMRCWPLVLLNDPSAVLQDCNLTNPTEVNRNSSQVYISALHAALEGKSKAEIMETALSVASCDKVKEIVDEALLPEDTVELKCKNKGWVLISLYAALHYFYHKNSFRQTVDTIIERGGDTDTNAAIAGALAGAFYGFDELMKDTVTESNWKIIKNADTTKGQFSRPKCYNLNGLLPCVDDVLMCLTQKRKAGDEVQQRKRKKT